MESFFALSMSDILMSNPVESVTYYTFFAGLCEPPKQYMGGDIRARRRFLPEPAAGLCGAPAFAYDLA